MSGVIPPHGAASRLIQLWQEEQIELVLCNEIVTELVDVLSRARIQKRYHAINAATIAASAAAFRDYAIIVPVPQPFAAVSRDPDDDIVVACALAGRADYIVTRDQDLLGLGEHQGIRILTPEMFLTVYRAATDALTATPTPRPSP